MNKEIAILMLIPLTYVVFGMIYLQPPVPPINDLENLS
jgi:hypothetical protein